MQKFFSVLILFSLIFFPSISSAEEKNKTDGRSAILIVSFGTSMPEARKAIDNLVNAAKKNFPECEVRLAFTSNIIRKKLAREFRENISNPVEALAKLNDEGFKKVYVMPTHIIPGEEYDEIKNVYSAFKILKGKYGFDELKLGTPFMNSSKDCSRMAEILIERFKNQLADKDTAIILMGHGTPHHFANALYSLLQVELDKKLYGKFFVGTVEAAPEIDDVIANLKRHPEIKKLILSPLMIVAGDHANNDLAGEDDEESWLNVLKADGYENISSYLVGLGEDENIAKDFVKKIHELISR
ncbi:MAG: sirohydrochlorin cobaltochelatase [Synergistales bacterium]|nr:sirohydrochlorin cobaltochelatase [Synergistales bacterium]MDY6400846.1 sirohydrochlorin cobaltochelatase [Synergistales bacterium]MDY6405446.1 sirohydrochlorin cobaltochelatase [Synergistales bacterium]MDY6410501.1 sirohydrochlorin cobaltochelatase [Synergistales bacterium]MDY6414639.1 sirohydrochlorin cobaltochelatase [Synergistales bacterium]